MPLMMKRATYSAKKKKPKRMPEYSVNGPATSSRVGLDHVERRAVDLGQAGDVEDAEPDGLPDQQPAVLALPVR